MKNYLLLLVGCLFFAQNDCFSQSPYQLNKKQEAIYLGIAGTTLGLAAIFHNNTQIYTTEEISGLNADDINSFDRFATRQNSLSAHHTSDYLWYGSVVMPLSFLAHKKIRKDIGDVAILWGEVFLLNGAITTLTKYGFQRTRPFVYNDDFDLDKKLKKNAKTSFISGHTSITAANTFFFAKVFSDYYPNSKWKPVVWVTSAAIPAATAYLRVKGGRHFPTDVMAGYAVGALIGYFVPHLHKINDRNNKLQLDVNANSMKLKYIF